MLHFIHSSFPFVKLKSQMPYVGVRIKSWEKQESSRRTLCAQTTLSCPIKGLSPEKDFSGWRIMVEQKEERSKASAAECNKCCLARPSLPPSQHQKHAGAPKAQAERGTGGHTSTKSTSNHFTGRTQFQQRLAQNPVKKCPEVQSFHPKPIPGKVLTELQTPAFSWRRWLKIVFQELLFELFLRKGFGVQVKVE